MWTKEIKADLRKGYDFIKAGRSGKPDAVLYARDKKDQSKWWLVVKCSEDAHDKTYQFIEPCQVCGRRHTHGNLPGPRGPHCEGDIYALMREIKHPLAEKEYFIANEEEYKTMWSWAKRIAC